MSDWPRRIRNRLSLHKHSTEGIDEYQLLKNRIRKTVYFMISILSALLLNILCLVLHYEFGWGFNFIEYIFTLFFSALFIAGFIVLPYNMKHYGLNWNGLRFNLIWGIGIGLAGLGISILARILLVRNGHPEFGFHLALSPVYLFYLPTVIVQEICTKGIIQGYFFALFAGFRYKRGLSIALTAVIFACFHILLGWQVFLLALAYSVLSSYFYEKTRSVVGVSIIHLLGGAGLVFFSPYSLGL